MEDSLAFKKGFIEADEFDRGARIHLNFAHTFGHAFETVSGYRIPHGTAVAMGMVVANRISLARGWLEHGLVKRAEDIVWKVIGTGVKDAGGIDIEKLVAAVHKDKKQTGKELTAVLLRDDMDAAVVHDVTRNEIEEAVMYLLRQKK